MSWHYSDTATVHFVGHRIIQQFMPNFIEIRLANITEILIFQNDNYLHLYFLQIKDYYEK